MTYTLITGASSGIGRGVALALAKQGHNLILVARRKEVLEALKKSLLALHPQLDIIVKPTDLSEHQAVLDLYDFSRSYDVRLWLNIAGLGKSGAIIETELAEYHSLLAVNVEAVMTLSTLFARDKADTEAQLINVSSAVGYVIGKNNVVYSASKFFVNAFTQGLANEMADRKLQVKIFAPALTATDFIGDLGKGPLPPYVKSVEEVVGHFLELLDSTARIGLVDETNHFVLTDKILGEFNGID